MIEDFVLKTLNNLYFFECNKASKYVKLKKVRRVRNERNNFNGWE